MEVDKGTKSEGFSNSGVKVKKECIGCLELEDKLKKANDKCAYLELDIGKKNCVIEWLEGKLRFMEHQKLKIEDEVSVFKRRNEELEKSILNVVKDKVLVCAKNKAESEIQVWKLKCEELEVQVMELEKRLSAGTILSGSDLWEVYLRQISQAGGLLHGFNEAENKANEDKDVLGNPPINTPFKQYSNAEGFKGGLQCDLKLTVRKGLDFAAEESPHKNISPSTPGGKPLFDPIDISDSDDDLNTGHMHLADPHCKVRNKVRSSTVGLWVTLDEKESTLKDGYEAVVEHQRNEEEVICNTVGQRMPKRRNVRRGVAYVVSSESESDDNIPISGLKSMNQLIHSSDTFLKRKSVDGSCFRDKHGKLNPRRCLRRVGDPEE